MKEQKSFQLLSENVYLSEILNNTSISNNSSEFSLIFKYA